jgi:ADP-ribose pyrophosphatase YjhB (NUDIX family)
MGESPAHTLARELREEWSVEPASLTVEALVLLPQQLVLVIGLAWLPDGAEIEMDDEHDAHAWWPADVADWPEEADEPLRRTAMLLSA